MTDAAIEWFLADAKSQGLSIREYEARYGIILLSKQHEIDAHETAITEAMESIIGDLGPEHEPAAGSQRRRADKPVASFAPYAPLARHAPIARSTRSCASGPSATRSAAPGTPSRSSGPRTPRRANRARTCVRPSSRGGSLIAA